VLDARFRRNCVCIFFEISSKNHPIVDRIANRLLKDAASREGLGPPQFSGHSLRRGVGSEYRPELTNWPSVTHNATNRERPGGFPLKVPVFWDVGILAVAGAAVGKHLFFDRCAEC
jgi:hypothetical protein